MKKSKSNYQSNDWEDDFERKKKKKSTLKKSDYKRKEKYNKNYLRDDY